NFTAMLTSSSHLFHPLNWIWDGTINTSGHNKIECVVFERHLLSIHFIQSQREWGMFHLLTGGLQHSLAEINSCELDVIGIVRKASTGTYTHLSNITMKVRKTLFPPCIANHLIRPIVTA